MDFKKNWVNIVIITCTIICLCCWLYVKYFKLEIVGLHNSKDLWLMTDFGKHRIKEGTFNKNIPYNIYKYVDGTNGREKIGTEKFFYENGSLMAEIYYDDKSNMLSSKSLYENGNLKEEQGYVDGKIVWEKCYNKNGELTSCEN